MTEALDATLVLGLPAGSLLRVFNRAGVLAPADVHVARRLGILGGDDDELVALAAAFAVRAPRLGHIRADLRSLRTVAESEGEEETDLDDLPWPDPDTWLSKVAASPLVAVGEEDARVAPLRLIGTALYLDRFWRDEREVAAQLVARVGSQPSAPAGRPTDGLWLAAAVGRLFPSDADPEQRWAVAVAALRGLVVIVGGPGTGKTTTVAKLIGLLGEQASAAGSELPLVALAAPTGKAANRMQEAVRAAAEELDLSPAVLGQLRSLHASTLHRLLRPRPDNASRFRYDRRNRLPHDVVIVDEASMLSLWLMARLVEAVRHDARLVLVGDAQQLSSVEAGAVLGDIVGPASSRSRTRASFGAQLEAMTGVRLSPELTVPTGPAIGDGIVVLRTNHRFSGALADLAEAIRRGDPDAALDTLSAGEEGTGLQWLQADPAEADPEQLEPLHRLATSSGSLVVEAARAGDGGAALAAFASWRILCAHRRGPAGVAIWNARVRQWLERAIDDYSTADEWYVGRPVVVTANDYGLRLFNGDTGVLVARGSAGLTAAFERTAVSPSRLSRVETAYAMTVHKAQGSEFDHVAVVLPRPASRILTRELLYTAVTRAKRQLLLAGTEEAVRRAIGRPIARASGLTDRLWRC